MNSRISDLPPNLRVVRPAPEPLGLYVRAGRNDHQVILNLIASGDAAWFGVVFDPTQAKRHQELKAKVLEHRLDAFLDTKAMQMSLPGTHTPSLGALPWGTQTRLQEPRDFLGLPGQRLLISIGEYVLSNGYTGVLAPTHLLSSSDDPWLPVDVRSARILREFLDQNGGQHIPLIYPLAIPYAVLQNVEARRRILTALGRARFQAVWLKIDRFGARATASKLRTYLSAATDFHHLGREIVADCVGGSVGLALLAFGAVGGIAHGITLLENFDSSHMRRPKQGKAFLPPHRVYMPAIDTMLTKKEAEIVLNASARAKAVFGCKDSHCCARGIRDMLENPGRHYLRQRTNEIAELSQFPEQIRPQRYLDLYLRPMTDKAVQSTTLSFEDESLVRKMHANRKRLDNLRVALGEHIQSSPPRTFAPAPETRVARESSY